MSSLENAWLKGVPLELRPRYFPKPPLRFKDIDIYIPLDALENDYDFTEERRVLAECKMYDEFKENERLAEEDRLRQLAEESERLRLLEESRLEQERLERDTQLAAESCESDPQPDSCLAADLQTKLELTDASPEDCQSCSSSSKPNSHHESPTSEDTSHNFHQPQPEPVPVENETSPSSSSVPVQPPQQHPSSHQFINNGYQYMTAPIYHPHPASAHHHQTAPHQYYNYYVPQHSLPLQQQHRTGMMQQMPPQQQQLQFQSTAPPILQPQTFQPVMPPVSTSATSVSAAPSQQQSGPDSEASEANSPTSSEATTSVSSSNSQQKSQAVRMVAPSRKVDLKDLSDFESDTANPFDNVELKSINDMEVLASVLKNHAPSTSHQGTTPEQPSTGSTYVNGGGGGGYYHHPTPIYPPVSSQQQCPYPPGPPTSWTQNGYFAPVTTTSTVVPPPTSIAPPQPPPNSHIPSPTQGLESGGNPPAPPPPTENVPGVNSFTKLHFPFLTSMAASRANRDRDGYTGLLGSSYNRGGYQPGSGSEDITSQNPFLSTYVQSHSPLQHHQYWPQQQSHFNYSTGGPAPVQNGGPPTSTYVSQAGPSSTIAPSLEGSQHNLR